MSKYLRKFETEAEYSAATIYKPSVSLISDEMTVIFDPKPSFKYKLTLSDGSTVSAECDSTSAITSAETSAYTSTLVSAEIGNCVTTIGQRAFYNCSSFTSVTIPSSVTSIEANAFKGCRSLSSITIPSSVTSIAPYAFRDCSGLTSIIVESTNPPALGTSAFGNTNNCPIYVPSASVETYKAKYGWSTYADRIQAIP